VEKLQEIANREAKRKKGKPFKSLGGSVKKKKESPDASLHEGPSLNNSLNKSLLLDRRLKELDNLKKQIVKDPSRTKKQNMVGPCKYCLRDRAMLVEFECGHSYCTYCSTNLQLITPIKKGLKYFAFSEKKAIKCTQCGMLNVHTDEKQEEIRKQTEQEAIRLKQAIKNKEAVSSIQVNAPPCMLCP